MPDLAFIAADGAMLMHAESTAGQEYLDEHLDTSRATWRRGSVIIKPDFAATIAHDAASVGLSIDWRG